MELPGQFEQTPIWHEVREQLRRVVGDSTYEIWLAALEVQAWDGERMVLKAPAGSQAWVSKRFGRIIESCIRAVIGSAVQVAFATRPAGARPAAPSRAAAEAAHAPLSFDDRAAFNPRYSFEQFIIGDGNRLAHAASLAVAELPGQAYNPLFLHAAPGLGKTHLLHAIGNYVLAFGAGATVRYTTVEAFTNHFITALHAKSVDRFKHVYRDVDVLLIDDVQFLASKAKTEEEFFYTFNALYETGRQLVLTCDRLPRQLVSVEERLRERFESGLVADIGAPDFTTRVAILRKRAVLDRIALMDQAVLELIAERVTDNIRALEGALIRVVAYHSLTGRPIDVDLAEFVLDRIYPEVNSRELRIDHIQAVVAGHYGLSVAELTSASRTAHVAWARQVAIHLARELTSTSLDGIGRAFGGRNHATVLHACRRVSERLGTDQQALADVNEISSLIQPGNSDRAC